jgi:hypothetical protein
VREYAGATRLGGVFSSGVVLSPAWQMVTVDYVSVAAGTSLDLQVLDFPLTTGEVFLADDVSIYDVTTSPTSRIETAQSEPGAAEVIVDMSRMEPLVGRVAPSPLRTGAHLRFVTSRPGALRVTLFDLTGRRVRRVTDELNAPAGPHDLVLDGLDDRGRALASGLYFYRIRALEGVSNGRVLIAR